MGHVIDKIAPIAAPVLGAALGSVVPGIGTALGAAVGSGLQTGISSGNPLKGLAAGAGSYAGGSLLSGAFGGSTVGSALGGSTGIPGLGSIIGDSAANSIGSSLANATLGSVVGSSLGSGFGAGLVPDNAKSQNLMGAAAPAAAAFKPSQQAQSTLPVSLASMSTLTPNQQATNLATQGTYGGGVGPQEQNYFLNLENRKLVDPQGQVGQMSNLSPIEQSYLQQLGLGGFSDPTSLLEAISKRAA